MRTAVAAVVLAAATPLWAADETDIWLAPRCTAKELESLLYAVSDPRSARYGKFLSEAELADVVGQPQAVVDQVAGWLRGLTGVESVDVSATRDKLTVGGVLPPHTVPGALRSVVRKVVRRTHEDTIRARRRTSFEARASGIGANEAREAYGIPASATGEGVTQLVWGPGSYGVLTSDVTKYWSDFGITGASLDRLKLEGYAGSSKGGDNFGEASLDTDIISGMAPGAVTVVSNTNNSKAPEEGPGFGYAQAAFLNQLAAESQPAEVVSLSLGSLTYKSCDLLCRSVAQQGVSSYAACLEEIQYHERQVCMFTNDFVIQQANTEFMKLGVRGVSVVAASGDGGMHFSFKPFSEFTALGRALNKAACSYAMPTFPASSPYVTSIGGTAWSSPGSKDAPKYWNGGGSGFSWDFAMPDYQKSIVTQYLSQHKGDDSFPPDSAYNASLRAYPDISALASGNAMCSQGSCFGAGGTSAAAPTFGGVVTLLNEARKKAGRPVLGFLNPALYAAAEQHADSMFYDVTIGNSKCSSETCLVCKTGFPATKGFDLATGWGAPRWAGLVKYL